MVVVVIVVMCKYHHKFGLLCYLSTGVKKVSSSRWRRGMGRAEFSKNSLEIEGR